MTERNRPMICTCYFRNDTGKRSPDPGCRVHTKGSDSVNFDERPATPQERKATAARATINGAIMAQMVPGDVEDRPIYPGAKFLTRGARPLPGLEAAFLVMGQARRAVAEYVDLARGREGASWEVIGHALGFADEAKRIDRPLDECAWRFAAHGVLPHQDYIPSRDRENVARWRCWTCGGSIREYGPGGGCVEELQTGHVPNCARLIADIGREQDALNALEEDDL